MVFVRDDGIFDAPIDKIWRFLNDMSGQHAHDSITEMKPIEQKGNVMKIAAKTKRPDGKTYNEVWQMTMFPPDGFMLEVLEGPGKGTTQTHTYIPMGQRTKVVVAGDFKWQGLNDVETRRSTLAYLESVFNEDQQHLKIFK
ncbi:MAG: SRPBCC family protein [Methanobacteriota archaeon]